jgi:xylan 1,4-beta-xylosidase
MVLERTAQPAKLVWRTTLLALLLALIGSSWPLATAYADATITAPWAERDIGDNHSAGSSSFSNGVFSIAGSGTDIGSSYDKFRFVYQPLTGDGTIIAQVTSTSINQGRAAVMIRNDLNSWPASINVAMALRLGTTPAFQYRAAANGGTTQIAASSVVNAPAWLRLERRGNTFTGSLSTDGSNWTTVGSANVTMGQNVFIGLAVNSGNDTLLNTATFANIETRLSPPAPWQRRNIGNTGAPGDAYVNNGAFVISGAGDEIGGSYDQFHYVYQPLSSDGDLVARITNINGGTDQGVKAALVIRETLSDWPPAREAIVGARANGSSFFAARLEPQTFAGITEGPSSGLPTWFKLTRRGTSFTGYSSPDGQTWTQLGQATIAMGPNVFVGLAGGGQTFGVLATSTFDNVGFTAIAGAPVAVNINWNEVRSTTTNFSYSLNGYSAVAPDIATLPAYSKNIAYMNAGQIRYHYAGKLNDSARDIRGWTNEATQQWDRGRIAAALDATQTWEQQYNYQPTVVLNIPDWPRWLQTYTATFTLSNGTTRNVTRLLDPSAWDAYAAFCAELVRIVNIEQGRGIVYFEITNERDDIYYVPFANNNVPDKLDELIEIYNRAAIAMRAVDPTIKVGGPAFARPDLYPQVERFVNATVAAGTLDFMSMHGYASGNRNEPDSQIYNRVYNASDPTINSLAKHAADVRAILNTASPNQRIPLWFNEFNISWTFTNNDPRMQNHKGAVFDALALAYLHDAGADATNAWNERDGIYGKSDGNDNLRPAAHLFALMNRYAIGERVVTNSSDASAVVAFAVKNDQLGLKTILLVNRSGLAQSVNLNVNGWVPRNNLFQQHRIGASGYLTSTVDWNTITAAEGMLLPDNSVTILIAAEKPVRPVLECVANNGDGSYTAFFGYRNDNLIPVSIPVGSRNKFTPSPEDRSQPTTFLPGRQRRVFSVPFDGNNLVWTLDKRTSTASNNPTQTCR